MLSTIVLKVDLECETCYKKIRKVLRTIQDKMNIETISFDEKSNAVTISGPFDSDMVCNRLCCKAGRVIKEMDVKGNEKDAKAKGGGGGDKPKDAAKPAAEEEGGNSEMKAEKAEKKEGKGDKEDTKSDRAEKGNKDGKAEAETVEFDLDVDGVASAADAKPGKAMAMPPGMTKADLGPLLEKMMAPGATQSVVVPSIWPASAGFVSGYYGCNPGYEAPPSYYGAGAGAVYGGYYGVPVYDSQGWYYGGGARQQPYYPHQQQHCCEDPNAGCSVM
ncbi:hypothetical protein ZEAMMB73_Zm00001d006810 [Zea mays]|uniref:HMA domain-containing protein n=1 Tax=Zea mays TaxID=4577 RepID=A0A1D6F120_MAIZE|nr:hypothetical protein ZEAMMB73_Zm00001d006810 [Zea mays]